MVYLLTVMCKPKNNLAGICRNGGFNLFSSCGIAEISFWTYAPESSKGIKVQPPGLFLVIKGIHMSSNFTPLEDSGTPMVNLMTDPIRRHFKPRGRESNETFISRFVSRSSVPRWFWFVKKKSRKTRRQTRAFAKLTSGGLWSNKLSNRPTPASWLWVTIRLTIFEAATFLVAFTNWRVHFIYVSNKVEPYPHSQY